MTDVFLALEWLFDRPLILVGGSVAYIALTALILWIWAEVRERRERNRKIYYVRPSGLYEKRRK